MTSLAATLAVVTASVPAPSDPTRIDGRVAVVVAKGATVPTKFATVRLVPQDRRSAETQTRADREGLFSFSHVPPGTYVVRTTSCVDVPRDVVDRQVLPLGTVDGKTIDQTLVSHRSVVDHRCVPLVSNAIHIGRGAHEVLRFQLERRA